MALAGVIKPFLTAVGGPLVILFRLLAQILQTLLPYVVQVFTAWGNSLDGIGPLLNEISDMLSNGLIDALKTLVPLLSKDGDLFARLAIVFGQLFVQALQQLVPYIPMLVDSFIRLVGVIADPKFITAAIQFVNFLIAMTPLLLRLTPVLIAIGLGFLGVVNGILELATGIADFVTHLRGYVQDVLDLLHGNATPLTEALKGPFDAAWDAISAVYDKIKTGFDDVVKGLKSKAGDVKDFFSKTLNPFSSGFFARATGGPVDAGQSYMVGEKGRELYVPGNGGDPKVIGQGGPGVMDFPSDGFIVPNYMLNAMDSASAAIAREAKRMAGGSGSGGSGVSPAEVRELVAAAQANGETVNYNTTIHVGGDTDPEDLKKIERAVLKALKEHEKDRKERR